MNRCSPPTQVCFCKLCLPKCVVSENLVCIYVYIYIYIYIHTHTYIYAHTWQYTTLKDRSEACTLSAFSISSLCEVHCELADWSPWTSCSKSCGGAIRTHFLMQGFPDCSSHRVQVEWPRGRGVRKSRPNTEVVPAFS